MFISIWKSKDPASRACFHSWEAPIHLSTFLCRESWDSSWTQSIDNIQFREQVEWELNGLDRADIIVVYFDPSTKSPITLLEVGLHAQSGKMLLCCPDGFWRKGNIEIVCDRYDIPLLNDFSGLIDAKSVSLGQDFFASAQGIPIAIEVAHADSWKI